MRRKALAGLLAAALMVAGCGDDDDPATEERPEDIGDIEDEQTDAAATVAPTPTAIAVTVQPEQLTYTVTEGDLLGTIAQRFDVPLDVLIEVNEIEDPNFIQIGDELVIPSQEEVEEWEARQAEAAPTTPPADTDDGTENGEG